MGDSGRGTAAAALGAVLAHHRRGSCLTRRGLDSVSASLGPRRRLRADGTSAALPAALSLGLDDLIGGLLGSPQPTPSPATPSPAAPTPQPSPSDEPDPVPPAPSRTPVPSPRATTPQPAPPPAAPQQPAPAACRRSRSRSSLCRSSLRRVPAQARGAVPANRSRRPTPQQLTAPRRPALSRRRTLPERSATPSGTAPAPARAHSGSTSMQATSSLGPDGPSPLLGWGICLVALSLISGVVVRMRDLRRTQCESGHFYAL